MKLYVLAWGDPYEDIVQGIFTTKEKALKSYEKKIVYINIAYMRWTQTQIMNIPLMIACHGI